MRRAAALVAALAVVAGCRSEPSAPAPSSTASPGAASATVEPTIAPEDGSPRPGKLAIHSPREGTEVSDPILVQYAVSEGASRHILVEVSGREPIFVELPGESGEVSVEGVPEGRHDITFTLARPDRTRVEGTSVIVRSVTVVARGAGGGGFGY